jgi:hypothetical protein
VSGITAVEDSLKASISKESCDIEYIEQNQTVSPIDLEDSGGADNLIEYLKSLHFYNGQLVHIENIPPKLPKFDSNDIQNEDSFHPPLPKILTQSIIRAMKIKYLYCHQMESEIILNHHCEV